MKKDKDFKIGDTVFIFDGLEEIIVETILSKIIRDENGYVKEYELACKDEYSGYTCFNRHKEGMYKTFDECLEETVREFRRDIINRSKKK